MQTGRRYYGYRLIDNYNISHPGHENSQNIYFSCIKVRKMYFKIATRPASKTTCYDYKKNSVPWDLYCYSKTQVLNASVNYFITLTKYFGSVYSMVYWTRPIT